jgi:hypothetical protein
VAASNGKIRRACIALGAGNRDHGAWIVELAIRQPWCRATGRGLVNDQQTFREGEGS